MRPGSLSKHGQAYYRAVRKIALERGWKSIRTTRIPCPHCGLRLVHLRDANGDGPTGCPDMFLPFDSFAHQKGNQ